MRTKNWTCVIMSVYKNDGYEGVRRCLDSLFSQTISDNVDIYVMADGVVSDEIDSLLMSYHDQSRLEYLRREENIGLAKTLNQLLEYVLPMGYEFIARMDADDECLPYRFEEQVAFLKSHQDVDIVGGYINEVSDGDIRVVQYPLKHNDMKSIMGKRNCIAHPTVMFRRSYFEKAGLYPTDNLRDEDTLMWLKGFKSGCQFANIPKVLVNMTVEAAFYKRRAGHDKSKGDYISRKKVIRQLGLPKINYLYAWGRYVLFRYASPRLLSLAYRYIR